MQNVRLDESKAEIKSQENTNNLRYADDTTLIAENEQELNSLLMRVKEENERAALKLNIQKLRSQSHHYMANRWGKSGNSDRFSFLGLPHHCGQ